MTNVSFSGTNHEENQPCHLQIKDKSVPININFQKYDNPETRYCPAGVYEIVENNSKELQTMHRIAFIVKQDIKDPTQNINWVFSRWWRTKLSRYVTLELVFFN